MSAGPSGDGTRVPRRAAVSVVLALGRTSPVPPPALPAALAAVAGRPDAELVVVEDGQPAARRLLLELTGRVRIRHSLPVLGARGARRAGVGLAAGRILVLLDAACELPDGWLDDLLAPFDDGDPGLGIVVPSFGEAGAPADPRVAPVVAVRAVALESVGGADALAPPDAGPGGLLGDPVVARLGAARWRVATADLTLPPAAVGDWPPAEQLPPLKDPWKPPVLPKLVRPGLNVVGLLEAACGVGDAARRYVDAVEAARVPFATFSFQGHSSPDVPFEHRGERLLGYDTNLLVLNPDVLQLFAMVAGAELWVGRYTIGIWFWELEQLAPAHLVALSYVNELWASSRFIADCLARSTDKPVVTVPLPVRRRSGPPRLTRTDVGMPEDFTFLTTFDFGSIAARKNSIGAVRAFRQAFEPGEGPVLVVKTLNSRIDRAGWNELYEATADRRDILVIDRYVTDEVMSAMVGHADCYVSLHRSEGFGLTPAEAMAWGRPVVATGYSGNTDFMTEENSYLVPYDLVPVPPAFSRIYPTSARWAEPHADAAAAALRAVWEHPEAAAGRGRRAQLDIRRTHSTEAAARAVTERLAELGRLPSRSGPGAPVRGRPVVTPRLPALVGPAPD